MNTEGNKHNINEYPCLTDATFDFSPPNDDELLELDEIIRLALDASNGFIPLWKPNFTLSWSLNKRSFIRGGFSEEKIKNVRDNFKKAIDAWGDAAPIQMVEVEEAPMMIIKYKIGVAHRAKAFFPNELKREIILYTTYRPLDEKEKVDILIHELGHIFGLRHTFSLSSIVFGTETEFSIMNPELEFSLEDKDKDDLKHLYHQVWHNNLSEISGIPLQLFPV